MNQSTFAVDFVAVGESPEDWKMVLVESGPWMAPIDAELRRVQGRLYNCIDAAIEGRLAEKFPASLGKNVIIQVDFYNVPEEEVRSFFERFSKLALAGEDYSAALGASQFVRGISFVGNFRSIH